VIDVRAEARTLQGASSQADSKALIRQSFSAQLKPCPWFEYLGSTNKNGPQQELRAVFVSA